MIRRLLLKIKYLKLRLHDLSLNWKSEGRLAAPLIMEHFIAVELLHLKSQVSSWSHEMDWALNAAQK
ncbi:hypothetical protein VCRA2116O29_270067 [Vibrio crassostreae]|nr:hypothetical protein VCRA2116O29_270067 [Vibrio crassostreae]CAK2987885.1 hypothetical protein VCRA2133E348_480013 [Vibrio crassostreae]